MYLVKFIIDVLFIFLYRKIIKIINHIFKKDKKALYAIKVYCLLIFVFYLVQIIFQDVMFPILMLVAYE